MEKARPNRLGMHEARGSFLNFKGFWQNLKAWITDNQTEWWNIKNSNVKVRNKTTMHTTALTHQQCTESLTWDFPGDPVVRNPLCNAGG